MIAYPKQMRKASQIPAPGIPTTPPPVLDESFKVPQDKPKPFINPDITTLPAPINRTPEEFAQSHVAAFSQQLMNDIFPREHTIERIVFEFKDKFPGPQKERDVTILYNAIVNNPDIKKLITLKNAVPTYNFIKEAINKAWNKKDDLIWAAS